MYRVGCRERERERVGEGSIFASLASQCVGFKVLAQVGFLDKRTDGSRMDCHDHLEMC